MHAAAQLKSAGIENEIAESEYLLIYACHTNVNFYLILQNEEMPPEQAESYRKLSELRCRRNPLQYLTGEQEFMGLPFFVNEHVLIPRQDTELLAEEALRQLRSRKQSILSADKNRTLRVLDLCTGSGCIAVSLKFFCPEIEVIGTDIAADAICSAKRNARRNGTNVNFIQSDLFSEINGRFYMIVSNPPYIPSDVIPTLMPEVRNHEPLLALDGSSDGLKFYQKITEKANDFLQPGGTLIFEIGYDQGPADSDL